MFHIHPPNICRSVLKGRICSIHNRSSWQSRIILVNGIDSKALEIYCWRTYMEKRKKMTAINVCVLIKFHNADRQQHCKSEQQRSHLECIRYNWKEYAGIYWSNGAIEIDTNRQFHLKNVRKMRGKGQIIIIERVIRFNPFVMPNQRENTMKSVGNWISSYRLLSLIKATANSIRFLMKMTMMIDTVKHIVAEIPTTRQMTSPKLSLRCCV